MLCFLCKKAAAAVFGMFPLCPGCVAVKVRKARQLAGKSARAFQATAEEPFSAMPETRNCREPFARGRERWLN